MQKVLKILIGLYLLVIPQVILAQTDPNAAIEASVRFYFADIPVMADIAKCETNFRQYNPDGSPMYDATGTYIGVFQIAKSIHTTAAKSLGLDLATIDGNMMYARHLYESSGTAPWKGCLPKQGTTATPVSVQVPTNLTVNLRMGMSHPEIFVLQKLLNKNGFVISKNGPGSPGSETNYFGSLTREAVKRFQCAKQIVCNGDETTSGYGRVGPHTRAIMNQL